MLITITRTPCYGQVDFKGIDPMMTLDYFRVILLEKKLITIPAFTIVY